MTDVAIMIPGVRLADIRRASRLLEEDRALRRANDVVVAFMLSQPLTKAWGEGFEASSDLMSLDVNRNLWLSRVDPKRRRHAVGTYTHVLDQWGIVYDQPLLLATRQAGAAIEGAVRQSITRLERLAVDTHGYGFWDDDREVPELGSLPKALQSARPASARTASVRSACRHRRHRTA
jgi:TnpA family transposase